MVAHRYRIEELVRSSPGGVVLAARHALLRKQVTLEILTAYTDAQEVHQDRRVRAARRAARLRTPHVARVVDIGLTEDAAPYIATERLVGASLAREIEERGRLPVAEACRWVLEACAGLAEAHAAGLVHGGLRPDTLFLAEPAGSAAGGAGDGATDRVLKITDFGSSSALDTLDEESGATFVGTPGYLAPEQVQGARDVDARTDVWALGVILYRLVSGALPFQAETAPAMLVAIVVETPAMLTDAPFELVRLVARCLEKDPSKRPASVAELARGLASFAGARGARLAEAAQAAIGEASASADDPGASHLAATASGSIAPVSLPATELDPDVDSDVVVEDVSEEPLPLTRPTPGGIAALVERGERHERDERDRPTLRTVRRSYPPRSERPVRAARSTRARDASADGGRSFATSTALLGGATAILLGLILPFVLDEAPRARVAGMLRDASAATQAMTTPVAAASPESAPHAASEVLPFVPHGDEPAAVIVPAPIPTPTPLVIPPSTAWRDPRLSPFARPGAPLALPPTPHPSSPRRDPSYTKKLLLDRK